MCRGGGRLGGEGQGPTASWGANSRRRLPGDQLSHLLARPPGQPLGAPSHAAPPRLACRHNAPAHATLGRPSRRGSAASGLAGAGLLEPFAALRRRRRALRGCHCLHRINHAQLLQAPPVFRYPSHASRLHRAQRFPIARHFEGLGEGLEGGTGSAGRHLERCRRLQARWGSVGGANEAPGLKHRRAAHAMPGRHVSLASRPPCANSVVARATRQVGRARGLQSPHAVLAAALLAVSAQLASCHMDREGADTVVHSRVLKARPLSPPPPPPPTKLAPAGGVPRSKTHHAAAPGVCAAVLLRRHPSTTTQQRQHEPAALPAPAPPPRHGHHGGPAAAAARGARRTGRRAVPRVSHHTAACHLRGVLPPAALRLAGFLVLDGLFCSTAGTKWAEPYCFARAPCPLQLPPQKEARLEEQQRLVQADQAAQERAAAAAAAQAEQEQAARSLLLQLREEHEPEGGGEAEPAAAASQAAAAEGGVAAARTAGEAAAEVEAVEPDAVYEQQGAQPPGAAYRGEPEPRPEASRWFIGVGGGASYLIFLSSGKQGP